MKFKSILFMALTLVLMQSVQAQTAEADPDLLWREIFDFHGVEYTYELHTKDFDGIPTWDSSKGDPPLSMSDALRIAKKGLARFIDNADGLRVCEIHLDTLGGGMWCYQIGFADPETEEGDFHILVKLNGSVVEPVNTPMGESSKSRRDRSAFAPGGFISF